MPVLMPGPDDQRLDAAGGARQSCSIGNSAGGTTDEMIAARRLTTATGRASRNSVASSAAYSSPVRAARVSRRQSRERSARSRSNRAERDVGVADVDGEQHAGSRNSRWAIRLPWPPSCSRIPCAAERPPAGRSRARGLGDHAVRRPSGLLDFFFIDAATARPEQGPAGAALPLRRRDAAERARQPGAGDRRGARHRHHRGLDRRAAGRHPLHARASPTCSSATAPTWR